MKTKIYNALNISHEEIGKIAKDIMHGALAIFPTDTVYGIGTSLKTKESISKMYIVKKRDKNKPFALLVKNISIAKRCIIWNEHLEKYREKILSGKLTFIAKKNKDFSNIDLHNVFDYLKQLAIRIPNDNFTQKLISLCDGCIIATSANISNKQHLYNVQDIIDTFNGKVDYIFTSNSVGNKESSIIDFTLHKPQIIR